mgnify:CR=1 FL=1
MITVRSLANYIQNQINLCICNYFCSFHRFYLDCAAVMLGINRMYDLGLSLQELQQLGAQLGSDVPFCMGGPTAIICFSFFT